ncbi:MAG TPA: hypothetical protein VNT79_05095, partial [Phycisphaerae bacterium]|nr:hypothetical protein [Phycisphaerae bacterium]
MHYLQHRRSVRLFGASLALLGANVALLAQEPINAFDSATQPSPGHVIFKEQFRYNRFDLNTGPSEQRGKIEDATLFTTLNVGIAPDVAISLRAPVIFREREFNRTDRVDRDQGVGDVMALAKWRIYRNDTGPLDSARLSLIGGMDVRTGNSPFTSDAYSPV